MTLDILKDEQFQKLEKEFRFLARARGNTLDQLSYIIVDTETTGLEPAQSELTEIGAIKVEGKELKDIFSSLIHPKKPISPEITRLTGIDDELVRDYPPAADVLAKFFEFIGSAILVAHNVEFDIPFLKHHLKIENDKELTNETICTVKVSRYLLPQLPNHKLHTVANHLGLVVANRHRAMGDAELTYQVWLKFLDLLRDKGINHKPDLDLLISRL